MSEIVHAACHSSAMKELRIDNQRNKWVFLDWFYNFCKVRLSFRGSITLKLTAITPETWKIAQYYVHLLWVYVLTNKVQNYNILLNLSKAFFSICYQIKILFKIRWNDGKFILRLSHDRKRQHRKIWLLLALSGSTLPIRKYSDAPERWTHSTQTD